MYAYANYELSKVSGTSGKNHFFEINGDLGMAGYEK